VERFGLYLVFQGVYTIIFRLIREQSGAAASTAATAFFFAPRRRSYSLLTRARTLFLWLLNAFRRRLDLRIQRQHFRVLAV